MVERIKNILLLLLCYVQYYLRSEEIKVHKNKIIIVPTGKLGDVVCATPIFLAVRKNFPNAYIYAPDIQPIKKVLEHSGLVDEYIPFKNIWDFTRNIRQCSIDIGIVNRPDFPLTAALYAGGVHTVIAPHVTDGFSQQETRLYTLLKKIITTVPFSAKKSAVSEQLKLLKPLGVIEKSTKKRLGFSKEAECTIDTFLSYKNFKTQDFLIGITPSAGNKVKEWPPERFGKLADFIQQNKKGHVLIIGGANDKSIVDKMKKVMETTALDTTGKWNIDELKALLARLHMFISVDTGPLNIAVALGIPTINILGPVPEYAVTIDTLNRIVTDKGRKEPAIYPLNNRQIDNQEARRQAEAITTEMVITEFNSLLETINKK